MLLNNLEWKRRLTVPPSLVTITIVVTFVFAAANSCLRAQHSLQLDDGAGHYSIITAATSGSLNTFALPAGGGTLLTTTSLGAYGWLLGGNTGSSPNNQLGTLDATSLQFVTGGSANVRMSIGALGVVSIGASNGFQVDPAGDLISIKSITYSWPSSQAASSAMVLSNDGTGSLSWVAEGSTIAPTVNSDYTGAGSLSAATTNDLTFNTNATYFRLSAASTTTLTGINSSGLSNGRLIIICNVGSNNITLSHEDAGSQAANRLDLPGGSNIILDIKGTATFIYDAVATRWSLVSTN